jgi:hypothetical protein
MKGVCMNKLIGFLMLCLLAFQTGGLAAPSLEIQVNELRQVVQQLQQTVQLQQTEINALKEVRSIPVTPAAETTAPQRPGSASQGRWNPDIGVVADTLFKHDSGREDTEGSDRLSVREVELVMGSFVDPYSRFDANIGFSDFEDVHIEEAYLTRFGLPLDTTARVGRFKPRIGKLLPQHRDVLDTADYPLVMRRYFGEDGFSKTGVDFTKPLDLPFDSAHEITAGILEGGNGHEGTAFGAARRRPTVYSHLRNFWDITDVTNFELGATHVLGSSDDDAGMETNILGVDGTFIHFYGPDQRIKLQSELFYAHQDQSAEENALGTYGLLDVRFHKRWAAGARFDYAELLRTGGSDTGYTGYLTFFQTEFARWRLQYNHIDSTSGKDDDQFLVQGIFAIGEHKHKLQ